MRAPPAAIICGLVACQPWRREGRRGVSGLLVYIQKGFCNIRAGSESCRAAAKMLPSEKIGGEGQKKMQKIKCGFVSVLGPLNIRNPVNILMTSETRFPGF